jgi:hypothetical protein
MRYSPAPSCMRNLDKYAVTGAMYWLGYFSVEEQNSKKVVTGFLKGRFGAGYQTMSGYFFKTRRLALQRFEP